MAEIDAKQVLPCNMITIGGTMKRLIGAAFLAIAMLAGCASPPQNPAQAVYAAHGTYTAALTAAVRYKQLPPCTAPAAPTLCAKPEAVKQLQAADDVAYAALSTAQGLVRTSPPGSPALGAAIFNATQAVAAFAAAVQALGAKP